MGSQRSRISLADGLIYEGEISNGKPSGKGSLTFKRNQKQIELTGLFDLGLPKEGKAAVGNLEYEGEFNNCQFTGKGIIKHDSTIMKGSFEEGTMIEGAILINKKQWAGKFTQNRQLSGEGHFKNEQAKRFLVGNFKQGNLDGKGSYTFQNQDTYQGQFSNGMLHGNGKYLSNHPQFQSYQGTFLSSTPSVSGKIKFRNGDQYSGQLKDGYFHGKGQYTYADGTQYVGAFYYSMMTGQCIIKYSEGREVEQYEGEVLNGLYNGLGVVHYKNGLIYKGYFLQNLRNGPGIIIYGKKMFKGLFIMDRLIGKIQQVQISQ